VRCDFSTRERKKTEFDVGSLTEWPTFNLWGLNLRLSIGGRSFFTYYFQFRKPRNNFLEKYYRKSVGDKSIICLDNVGVLEGIGKESLRVNSHFFNNYVG
jgi:hypothetical protein